MTADELRTLRALTARLLPGPPEDPDPGALEAGAAEAIERLLCAFDGGEPPIHGAQQGGFVALDSVAELGWRIRLEGSQGRPEREFAGPVTGLAQVVADGLSLLDRRCREAHGVDFADAPACDQDALIDTHDEQLTAFVRTAMTLTLEAVYGPEQYGGNRDRCGWSPLHWPGFQSQGFTPAQISEPDGGAPASLQTVQELRSRLADDAGWRSEPG